jgi:hypothetical protein
VAEDASANLANPASSGEENLVLGSQRTKARSRGDGSR